MSDDDLIRRWDAMAAVRTSDFRWDAEEAIAALPAVTVGVPTEAQFMDAVWAALKSDATDLGKQQRILAALRAELEPVAAPRRYMGQIMAECDCSRQGECEAAQKCLAEQSDHDPAAIREAALREAAAVCEYVIKNIDILKADGETYETPRVQKIARGLVNVARQDILALIAKGAADDRA